MFFVGCCFFHLLCDVSTGMQLRCYKLASCYVISTTLLLGSLSYFFLSLALYVKVHVYEIILLFKKVTFALFTLTAVVHGVVIPPHQSQNPMQTSSYLSFTHRAVPVSTRDSLLPGQASVTMVMMPVIRIRKGNLQQN